jgi:hypothetical protein
MYTATSSSQCSIASAGFSGIVTLSLAYSGGTHMGMILAMTIGFAFSSWIMAPLQTMMTYLFYAMSGREKLCMMILPFMKFAIINL